MKKTLKKGFTIVELVIVIAVVAILAAVLIPTFVSVVNKANVSNDTALVRNINTVLATEEVTEGRPATMYDALKMAENGGFDVSKLTPRSSGDIVWDSETNRFALVDGDKTVYSDGDKQISKSASVWKIVDSEEAAESVTDYSVYLKDNATIADNDFTVKTGLDVGNNNVNSVKYENTASAKNVVIRTNGGKLTVDAVNDHVEHYGLVDSVVINAVADNSYEEYGKVVGNIEVAKGRVVVDSKAEVESVIATTANVTIDVQNNTTEVKASEGIDLNGKVDGVTVKTIKYVTTIDELQNAEGEVVLSDDLKGSVIFSSGKTIILDANGHTVTGEVDILNGSNITIKGNGIFYNSRYLFYIGNKAFEGGKLTIESGNFTAGEACIANYTDAQFTKSTVIINGGTFTSQDNGVFMSNGSSDMQGANWIINDGIFNGNIKSKGYIALGMYISNTDIATINGGTFNIKNGVGIVCRSGKTTIGENVVINIENDGTIVSGKVGDSVISLNVASYIVDDEKSNYPAGAPEIINNSKYSVIEYKDVQG